jgi:hypothetical protein
MVDYNHNVFDQTPVGIPSSALSFSLDLSENYTIKATMQCLGDSPYSTGDIVNLGGSQLVVTNVSGSEAGLSHTSTVVFREKSHEEHFRTLTKNLTWFTAPAFMVRPAKLANKQQPFRTRLLAKEGDVFGNGINGVDGWKMKAICEGLGEELGLTVVYSLPDFNVKSLSIDRKTPVVSWIKGQLQAFLPRVFVTDGTLYILPQVVVGATVSLKEIEKVTTATTHFEDFKTMRVSGGQAEFDQAKWEGQALLENNTTLKLYVNAVVGFVTIQAVSGYRHYISKVEDYQSMTITSTTYALDAFGNDQVMVLKDEWQFRKVDLELITDLADLKAKIKPMENYEVFVVEGGDDISGSQLELPNINTDYLVSCDRKIYEYSGLPIEWETPLVTACHEAHWCYNWWSRHTVTQGNLVDGYVSPPVASVMPEDNAPLSSVLMAGDYQDTINTTQSGAVKAGMMNDIIGVWDTEAFYTKTVYKYQYRPEDVDRNGMVGGFLEEVNKTSSARVRHYYANCAKKGGAWTYTVPEGKDALMIARDVQPGGGAVSAAVCVPNLVSTYMQVGESIESYRNANLYTVEKITRETKLKRDFKFWYNPSQQYVRVQYEMTEKTERIPANARPHTVSKRRGMVCYEDIVSAGQRFIDIRVPLIVNWDDLAVVAPHIRAIHPLGNQITTVVVESPQVLSVSLMFLGVPASAPNTQSLQNARVVGMSQMFNGDGGIKSQLAIQGE